jgi:hypothetical protein
LQDHIVYRLINNVLVTAEPIQRVFPGLPDTIDSAFVVSKDNLTYFTKGRPVMGIIDRNRIQLILLGSREKQRGIAKCHKLITENQCEIN